MRRNVAGLDTLMVVCAAWSGAKPTATGVDVDAPAFTVRAPWEEGGAIPREFACDGDDRSPAIHLQDLPDAATHTALLMDDPDAPAGTWVHWLWWDAPIGDGWPSGNEPGTSGMNSWGRNGYGGPCPPSGRHRYFIHVYALDGPLDLPAGSDCAAFAAALPARVVGHAQVMGTYTRQ